jgi:hypothetical protein
MEFIKPQLRKSHKQDPIIKNIFIKPINIMTLHTTHTKFGNPIFSVSDLLQSFEFSGIFCLLLSILKDKQWWANRKCKSIIDGSMPIE